MSEKLQQKHDNELTSHELEAASKEQRERLSEQLERRAEKSPERDAEKAKHEALEQAGAAEKERKQESRPSAERKVRSGKRTKKSVDQSFKKQMKEVQSDMSPVSRSFSKFIHVKPIEKASEAIGSTVARPNAILAGSFSAFVLVTALYVIAQRVGYPLSGFETIGAFIVGWIVGIMIDFFRIMITGKR